jgi:hypothetical protein
MVFSKKVSGKTKEIEVFNSSGRRLLSFKTEKERYRINTSELPDGLYLIKVMAGRAVGFYKFIKQ